MLNLPKKGKKKLFARTTILEYLKACCENCHKNGIRTTKNLTLDHKNWDRADTRITNLRILCLKCHRNKDQWDKKKSR